MSAQQGTTPMDRHLKASHEAISVAGHLAAALEDVDRIDHLTVLARLRDNQEGQPGAASYDGPSVTGSPTPRAPIRFDKAGRLIEDPSRRAEREYLDAARRITRDLHTLMRIAGNTQPRNGRDAPTLRAAAEQDNRHEPKCESCERVNRDEIPHTKQPTDVGGRLERGALLCLWCYEFVATTAAKEGMPRLPTEAELNAHHLGKRIHLKAS